MRQIEFRDPGEDPFSDCARGGIIERECGKLIPANTSHHVRMPKSAAKELCCFANQGVSCCVAEFVIHVFQSIDIGKNDCARQALAPGDQQALFRFREKAAAILQARQFVLRGQFPCYNRLTLTDPELLDEPGLCRCVSLMLLMN